ncbi:30S ribosomal protein S1 [Serratia fonticola]|uniref:30S ribosomal protein S1 n=1 Tax=Serratia fonticola TaxID=47917 RepID=A0A4U9UX01_SERFO|nr:30S ribosomal protein S1 [Serratia fonticola]
MTESFAQLFEESLKTIETRPGSIVRGVVVAIDKDVVLVDAGLKSESAIRLSNSKTPRASWKSRLVTKLTLRWTLLKMASVKLCCPVRKLSVTKLGSRWKKLTKKLKLSSVLSTAKLRVASL